MIGSVFDKHGCLKVVPTETGYKTELKKGKGHKPKHTDIDNIMNDPEVIAFCLNCEKKACLYGHCDELEVIIREKKAKR